MVDDAVENGLGPGGRPAKLFQHHRCHAFIQCLKVVTVLLAICPAFGHFFSEKFSRNGELWADSVNFDVQTIVRNLAARLCGHRLGGWVVHCPGQVGHPLGSDQG